MPSPSAPAAASFGVLVLIAPARQLEATSVVLAELPPDLPVAVLIAPAGEARPGLENLRHLFPLPIQEAEHGTVLEPGGIYVGPAHAVLEVRPGLRCTLTPREELPSARPLDQLLTSLALSAGPRALVVVLGGEDRDGVDGARALRGVGGTVLVQRPEGGNGAELPGALLEAQAAALVLSPGTLGRVVADLLGAPPREADSRAHRSAGILAGMDEAYAVVEVLADGEGRWTDFRFLEVNSAFLHHTGMPYPVGRTATELLGTPNPRWAELYGQVAQTGEPLRVQQSEETLGRVFDLNIFRLGGEGSRQVAVLFTDVTGRRRREANRELLLELSRDLGQLTSEEALVRTVGAKLVAHLGLTCYHYVDVDEDRAEVTLRHFWHALDVPPILGTCPVGDFLSPERLADLRAGEAAVIGDVQADPSVGGAATAALKAGAEAQKIAAYVAVPYSQGGRWHACFAVADSQRRAWTSAETELIQEVVRQMIPRIERIRAEAALRASEARYQALFAVSPVPFMVLAPNPPDFTITAANDAYGAATRTTPDTLIGRRLFDVFPDDPGRPGQLGSEALAVSLARVLATRQADAMERVRYDLVTPGGFEPHWWEAINAPMLDASGEVSAIIHQVSRVTELHLAQAAEREQQERQAFLLDLSDALRAQPTEQAIKARAVERLAAHLGLDRCYISEVFGAEGRSTVGPEHHRPDLPPMSGTFRLADYPGTMRQLATQPMTVRDATHDVRFAASEKELLAGLHLRALLVVALRKGAGQVIWALAGAMTTPRDWTDGERSLMEDVAERTWAAVERVRAEQAVRESEEKYRTLFDSVDEGFCLIELIEDDRGEAVDYRFLDVNRVFERQTGLVGAAGKRVMEIAPATESYRVKAYEGVARTGEPVRFEHYTEHNNRWYQVSASRVGGDGSRQVAIVFDDITGRRQREQQQGFLLRFSDALRAESGADAVADRALGLLAEQLRLDRCYIGVYHLEEDRADFTHQVGNNRVPPLPGGIRLSDFPGALRVAFDRTLVIDDVERAGGLSDLDRQNMRGLGMGALVAATLRRGEGQPLWAVVAVSADTRPWTPGEIALLEDAAERTWAAVERARAEQAVRESETRFRAVANLVPDLLWESQPDGFNNWYNQRWLDYTGQTYAQATGWGWTDAIHPDDREGLALRHRQAGQSLRREHRIRRHDGEYRWFVVNTFPLRDERGEVVRLYGAATDIHHLRVKSALLEARVEERTRHLAQLNTELQSRTRALEAFADLTRTLAPHLDPYALIQRGQEVALSLLPEGFATYHEPAGPHWRLRAQVGDMRNPALQAAAAAGLAQGQVPSLDQPWTSGAATFQEHYAPDTDGLGNLNHSTKAVAALPLTVGGRRVGIFAVALFQARVWAAPDRAALETVVRSLGLALERAEAVRALAEERDALSTFAHFTERAAEIQDVPTLAQQATAALQQVLSPGSAAYFEREGNVWRLHHASGHLDPELAAALHRGVPAERPAERQEPLFFEHGDAGVQTPAPFTPFRAMAAYPLFPQDHPAGMLSMALTDRPAWTEREKAVFRAVGDSFRLALERTARWQQIERQRERLADLNAELGHLITRTAHNLEAPAQKLGHLLGPGPSGDPQPFDGLSPYDPALLQDEITRLKGVAGDLRQLSRLEVHPLTRELLPLGELFAEVREGGALAPGRQVSWHLEPLPIVRGDRGLLRQALEVLMGFVLSATRGARYVTVSRRDVEGEVHVTVEDDGVGLTAEEAATLFDLTVRTDQGVPLLEGGGLIQVRRILARHGGWAWAEVGGGGRVVLAFPRDEAVNELEALFREDLPGR